MSTTQSVFNHKFRKLTDSLGIDDARKDEIHSMLKAAISKSKETDISTSEMFEMILANGLSVIETAYAFYMLGIHREASSNPIGKIVAHQLGMHLRGGKGESDL